MKRVALTLCLAALAVAAPAAAATPPEATAARACGSVTLTLGKSVVRAQKVRCADARRFVSAMLRRDCSETRDCNFSRFTFRGYTCVKRVSATLTKNSCTKGRKAISELHA